VTVESACPTVYDDVVFVVAIHALDPQDSSRAPALAEALGCTAYEARGRLVTAGPSVVAQGVDREPLAEVGRRLKAAGFRVILVDTAVIERPGLWYEVRSFELAPAGWRVMTRGGERTAMRWDRIDLVVRGRATRETMTTEVQTEKRFSAARAIATGGMVRSKKTTTETTHTETTPEGFLHVFAHGAVAVIRETAVDYGGLGEALEVSRAANFMALLATLRERAPRARFDDRLLRHVAAAQILGTTLDPVRYARLASALIATAAAS
jgi:hypothetical protein